MIWRIAQKDFLQNVVSARFFIGFLLCLFLIPFTLLVNIDDYGDQIRVYNLDKARAEERFKEVRVYSYLRPEIVRSPEPLSIFCRGISHNVGNRVRIELDEKPLFATGRAAIRDNPFLNSFFSIDFVSIIAIIMSLLAFIFTYDACTREKENGTLKLQLSNSMSRSKILLGKVVGVYLTLLPIMLFCYLLSIILILFSPSVSFSATEWIRIGLLFFASLLYLSIFIFIGLFISTRLKSSITSIIVCLFFWVFFVFIVPNLSVYLAESFVKVQSRESLRYALRDLDDEFDDKCEEYNETLDEPDWGMNWNMSGGSDGMIIVSGCTKSMMGRYKRQHEFSEPLRIDYADKKWALQKAYIEKLNHQRNYAEMISLISPSEVFRLISSTICLSNVESYHRFMERVRIYREEFIDFFRSKNIFSSFSYFTPQPPETFMLADEIIRIRTGGEFNTLQEYEEWAAAHNGSFAPLWKVEIPGTLYREYPFLDVSDVPRFQWQSPNILTDIGTALLKIAGLIFSSIVLFYLAFLSFIKYDVR